MKGRRGFTLIELLAVVVILAVIALITTPIVMSIIDNAQAGAMQDTSYGIVEAAKLSYTNQLLNNSQTLPMAFIYTDGIESANLEGMELEYKGTGPKNGVIVVDSEGKVAIAIHNGKFCAKKSYDDIQIEVVEKSLADCNVLDTYKSFVNDILVTGTKDYTKVHTTKLPNEEEQLSIVTLDELKDADLLADIYDNEDSSVECDAYIQINKTGANEYSYDPYFKCGTHYETIGYVSNSLTSVEVLVIAGGGSGGSHSASTSTAGSGGGAGGLIYNANYAVTSGTTVTGTVGNGGLGTTTGGYIGVNSVFGSLTAIGGGRGTGNGQTVNANGGSGAGASYYNTTPGTAVVGQGNTGGLTDKYTSIYPAAGGGGAGSKGSDAPDGTKAGNGGAGLYFGDKFSDAYGANGWFAGGGGGGVGNGGVIENIGLGTAGSGNGGYNATSGVAALANTGSGGGGSGKYGSAGGNGGSGIVLVRYVGSRKANGGIISTYNGYTIHAFLSGTVTFVPLSY